MFLFSTRQQSTHPGPKHSTQKPFSFWRKQESDTLDRASISRSPREVRLLDTGAVQGGTDWALLLGGRVEWESSHRGSLQGAVQKGEGRWLLVRQKWVLMGTVLQGKWLRRSSQPGKHRCFHHTQLQQSRSLSGLVSGGAVLLYGHRWCTDPPLHLPHHLHWARLPRVLAWLGGLWSAPVLNTNVT